MNRNKEYRLKRKAQRKDYIIQDKNLTIKTLYYRNETKRNKIEQLEQKNEQLQQENKQLKERITYLENSNNRREETIINLRHEQQLDKYKEVIDEVREFTYKSKVIVPMEYAINVGLFKKKIVEILDKEKEKQNENN